MAVGTLYDDRGPQPCSGPPPRTRAASGVCGRDRMDRRDPVGHVRRHRAHAPARQRPTVRSLSSGTSGRRRRRGPVRLGDRRTGVAWEPVTLAGLPDDGASHRVGVGYSRTTSPRRRRRERPAPLRRWPQLGADGSPATRRHRDAGAGDEGFVATVDERRPTRRLGDRRVGRRSGPGSTRRPPREAAPRWHHEVTDWVALSDFVTASTIEVASWGSPNGLDWTRSPMALGSVDR